MEQTGLLGFKSFVKCAAITLKITNSCALLPTVKCIRKTTNVYLLLDAQCRNDIIKHNEQVKKKRVILRQFIDALRSLANKKFLFWGYDEPSTS
jgi:hypothetical protein